MASLAELRSYGGGAAHPGHLSYENQYATSFNGFDPMAASHMLPPSGNQLDFLFYADQLLNTFATTKNSNGDVVLSGKTRDLMEFLPNDTESLPGVPASFPHSDFLPPAHSLPFSASQFMSNYGHSDAQSEDMWGLSSAHHPSKTSQHTSSQLPYQGYSSTQHRHQLPAIVKQQEWRLCVKAPTLGTFYLFTDPEKTVAEMIPDIESKILELYHVFVSVHLLQNDHGIDLPFSCTISSVLEDRALICVQYMRAADATAGSTLGGCHQQQQNYHQHSLSSHSATEEASPSARSPHSSPHSSHTHSPASVASPCSPASSAQSAPHSPFLHGNSPQHSSTGSAPTSPSSPSESQPDTGMRFREPPPSKVLQNKEFSFTVSVKNLKNIFTAFNNPLAYAGHQVGNDADSGAYCAPAASTTRNPWGAPVPMPMDDGEEEGGSSFSNFEIPIDVVVEEEGGGILHPRDYRIRCSVLDKQEGLYVFFVKLKKNSHYGRTRFIIKIRRKQPTKQERNLEYLETALLHNSNKDGQLRLGNDQGARGDLLVSHPIVVISKERKTKRKRGKPEQN